MRRTGRPLPIFLVLIAAAAVGRARRRYWGRGFGSWPGFRRGMWGRAPFLGMEPLGEYGIHIIGKNGEVMLFGTVGSDADKTKAGLEARGVFGVHSVDNEIQVVND
jgi:hypothetical protein